MFELDHWSSFKVCLHLTCCVLVFFSQWVSRLAILYWSILYFRNIDNVTLSINIFLKYKEWRFYLNYSTNKNKTFTLSLYCSDTKQMSTRHISMKYTISQDYLDLKFHWIFPVDKICNILPTPTLYESCILLVHSINKWRFKSFIAY